MRVFLRGLNVLCAFALIGSLAATAMAQQAPVRIVQGSDGTLYVLQGSNSWTLVPDPLSDSDATALTPGGEIDGTLPDQLFASQAPAAPAAAPAQPPAAAAPTPTAVPAAPQAAPITGSADLTGKAGNDIANATLIAPNATITSVVDITTKPLDVYAIALSAGTTYKFLFTGIRVPNPNYVDLTVLNPNLAPAASCPFNTSTGDVYGTLCQLTPAEGGTYYVKISARASGQKYTWTVRQS